MREYTVPLVATGPICEARAMAFTPNSVEDSTYYMEVMSLPENFKCETELAEGVARAAGVKPPYLGA